MSPCPASNRWRGAFLGTGPQQPALPHAGNVWAGMCRLKETPMKPNEEQLAALRAFASRHGRYWKQALMQAWLNGKDANEPNGHLLRQVRNELGPAWLEKAVIE